MKEWPDLDAAESPDAPPDQPVCALVTIGEDAAISYASDTFAPLFGVEPDDVVGTPFVDLFQKRHAAALTALLDTLHNGEQTPRTFGSFWLDIEASAGLLVEVAIDPHLGSEVVLVLRDVTSTFVSEQKQRTLHDRSRAMLDDLPAAITRWNRAGELEYHSREFVALVSVEPEDLLARPKVDKAGFTESATRLWQQTLAKVVDTAGPVDFDWETVDAAWMHARAVPEYGADGFITHVLVVNFDVTEHRNRYEELTVRALIDPLTGLANRATAMAHINRALERRGRTATSEALIYLDLDRFKSINDSLGHAVGDEVLITVGKRIQSVMRPHDVVSRLGGDEFIVFVEQMPGIEQVLLVVERIRAAVGEPLTISGREVPVKASIGVAFATERNETAAELMSRADQAMYKAKKGGRDRVEMYDEELRQQAEQRMRNELALARAMRNGEMEVHFLPEFDLTTRKAIGAEALIRWHHPERGLVPAAEFITLAEESGLLVTLGNEVMRRACELVAGWLRTYPIERFTLRVNLSARQLAQATLVADIREVLDDTKLDPRHVCLELSEGTLMNEPDEVLPVLYRLNELGVSIAIDDFGRGASSLAQLKQLPVDHVLIDRSFVWEIHRDERDEAIVKAIVDVTAALGLGVAAVGIDDEEQLAKLLELGCERGQGYLLSKVVRPNEFVRRFI